MRCVCNGVRCRQHQYRPYRHDQGDDRSVTDFPYIGGIEVSAIQNREFIRIETDKAQAIVVALDKSNIPFSARFGDNEMVLTYDGSYKEQVEEIIAKAQSGDYEALLR